MKLFYENLTREQAWDVVRHIEARTPYRLCLLAEIMRDTGGPLAQMDASLESLVPMWEWFEELAVADFPGVPTEVPSLYEPTIAAHASASTADWQRRTALLSEGLMHYVELVLRRVDPEARWDLWLQPGRILMEGHQEPVIRLSNGRPIHVTVLVRNLARRYRKTGVTSGARALHDVIVGELPRTWRRRRRAPQPSVLEPYLSYADRTPPAIVTISPLAVLYAPFAPTPTGDASDDVGVELLLAVGPAAGLDDPRHFSPLPVDTVAAVLAELDLTDPDGRPVGPRQLLTDGTQLFSADGTAVVETVVARQALRALSRTRRRRHRRHLDPPRESSAHARRRPRRTPCRRGLRRVARDVAALGGLEASGMACYDVVEIEPQPPDARRPGCIGRRRPGLSRQLIGCGLRAEGPTTDEYAARALSTPVTTDRPAIPCTPRRCGRRRHRRRTE